VEKDIAFCFYCYPFKPPRVENNGNITFQKKKGFLSWRNGLEMFTAHVGKDDSIHNNARKHALAFKKNNV
jgi:hypothetical protein